MSTFPIQIITNLEQSNIRQLVLEIRTVSRIKILQNFGFSPLQIDEIHKHFTKNEEKEKMLIFTHSSKLYDTIICFFPTNLLFDDRSEFCRGLKQDTIFFSDGDEEDAFEVLTLASYSFEKYLSKPKGLKHTIVVSPENRKIVEQKIPLLESILWARDLINTPPQDSNPEKITKLVIDRQWRNFDVEVVEEKELKKLGCNLILAVGAGSDISPRMIILKPKKPISGDIYGLIGKGVTFDAGGLQIKPDTAMFDMKCDMSGAAGMLGVAMYLDTLDTLPANVVIAVGLVENLVGGSAFKPLDIYKAYNGTTVEIHHTDAE